MGHPQLEKKVDVFLNKEDKHGAFSLNLHKLQMRCGITPLVLIWHSLAPYWDCTSSGCRVYKQQANQVSVLLAPVPAYIFCAAHLSLAPVFLVWQLSD